MGNYVQRWVKRAAMGFITTIALVSAFGLVALRPPIPRHSSPWNVQFTLGYLINEQPFLGLYWLAAGTVTTLAWGDAGMPLWWLSVGAVAVPVTVLIALAVRARTARPALRAALRQGLRDHCPQTAVLRRSRIPLIRVLFLPVISYRPDVRRFRNLRYGEARRGHLLDVYASRRPPQGAPVLIYLHGGGFRIGSKMLGARPLLYRLASHGWVCVSANYRLSPRASYGDRVIDVKRVIAWVREHGAAYGADPSTVILAGGSAGAHLAATAACRSVAAEFGLPAQSLKHPNRHTRDTQRQEEGSRERGRPRPAGLRGHRRRGDRLAGRAAWLARPARTGRAGSVPALSG